MFTVRPLAVAGEGACTCTESKVSHSSGSRCAGSDLQCWTRSEPRRCGGSGAPSEAASAADEAGVTLRAPREASDLPGRERQVEALELMAHLSHQEASVSVQSSEVTTREDGQSISLKLAGITDEIVKKRNNNF